MLSAAFVSAVFISVYVGMVSISPGVKSCGPLSDVAADKDTAGAQVISSCFHLNAF